MFRFWIPPWLHHPATYYLPGTPCKVPATTQMRRLRSPMLVQLPLLRPQISSSNSWKDWGFVWLSRPKVLGNWYLSGRSVELWGHKRASSATTGSRDSIIHKPCYAFMSKTHHGLQQAFCRIVLVNSWCFLEDAPLCERMDDGLAPWTVSAKWKRRTVWMLRETA